MKAKAPLLQLSLDLGHTASVQPAIRRARVGHRVRPFLAHTLALRSQKRPAGGH